LTSNAFILKQGNLHAAGVMRNLDASGNLQFETGFQVSRGSLVEVQCSGDFSATGNAMYCRPCGNAYLIGVRLRRNRRREPRFEATGTAIVAEFDSNDSITADIKHVSLSGIGLITTREVYPQTLVRLETSSWVVFGEVRHCTAITDGRYSVGIIFMTETFEKDPASRM
jgi:hypothetical protein